MAIDAIAPEKPSNFFVCCKFVKLGWVASRSLENRMGMIYSNILTLLWRKGITPCMQEFSPLEIDGLAYLDLL